MEPYDTTFSNIARVVGPTREVNSRYAVGIWWFAASYRGRDVQIGLAKRHGLTGIHYRAPLPRPIRFFVGPHSSIVRSLEVVPTGNPSVDASLRVHASPVEIVPRAFAGPLAALVAELCGPLAPGIRSESGWIDLWQPRSDPHARVTIGTPPLPTPEVIARGLDAALRLSDLLVAAFDAEAEALAAARGPAARDAWIAAAEARAAAQQQGLETGRSRARFLVGCAVGGVVALVVVVLVVVVAVAVGAASWLR